MNRKHRTGSLMGCLVVCILGMAQAEEKRSAEDEALLKEAKVATDGPALLDFLRKRTREIDPATVKILIQQLGDDSFQVREQASSKLVQLGRGVEGALQEALKDPDPEVVRRAEECLRRISKDAAAPLSGAVVRLIGQRKPAGAAEVLLAYLPFADGPAVAEDVRAALAGVAVRGGKADPSLMKALADKLPMRRAAAAEALAQAGAVEHLPALRQLLQDPDAEVRLRVALGLARLKEKEAVPVLIDLLKASPIQRHQAEAVLYDLAGDQAPTISAGSDEASLRKYHDAWSAWWRTHGAKVDLSKLQEKPRLLGHTLIVLLDQNRIIDLDPQNQIVWQINELDFPLDVQLLAPDRVLIVEHGSNRVTERDKTGKVLWEKDIFEPLAAQRLPNGNTFIGSKTRLVEVDRTGKEVFSYARPNGDLFMRAQKLRNGDIACITSTPDIPATQRFVRLDATGKELNSFRVEVRTFGGKIDVLPNGNVIVPEMSSGKVIEYDAHGKAVAQVAVEQPIAAIRLPNGNTLITSMNQMRAIELDRDGKQVWEYRSDTRVTRAVRH